MTNKKNIILENWTETTLGEVVKIGRGSSPRPIQDFIVEKYGIPWVKIADATASSNRYVEKTKEFIKEEGRSTTVLVGDLIVSNSATPGIPKFMKIEACVHDGWLVFSEYKDLDKLYLYYFFLDYRIRLEHSAFGTVFKNLTTEIVRNVPILLPPLPEQQAIASVLSSFDDKIELLREENKTLEELGQTIFKEWFGKYSINDELPEGWRVGKLGEIVDLLNGFAYKSSDFIENGKYRLVTIANVQDGHFVEQTKDGLNEIPQKMPDYCNLKTGDILLSLTGNVGRICHVVGENYFLNQRVAKLQAKEKQDYGFIYTMFRQDSMFGLLESISAGTAQQNLSPIRTAEIEVIIPSRDILNNFTNIINPMIDKMLDNKIQIQSLAHSRDELLPKLMSGEMRVKF